MAKLVDAAMRSGNVTFPQLQALTGMVPLYNKPLDAKNQIQQQLLGVANAALNQSLVDANGDEAKSRQAREQYQQMLEKAINTNPLDVLTTGSAAQ